MSDDFKVEINLIDFSRNSVQSLDHYHQGIER